MPEHSHIEGEKEEERHLVQVHDLTANQPIYKPKEKEGSTLPLEMSVVRMKGFMAKGLYKRAVVCKLGVDPVNPIHWGIIMEVRHTHAQWPFEVVWTDGHRSWTDGTDVFVIYRGMTEDSFRSNMNQGTTLQ
jgi:hypothetical protein